MVCGGDNHGFEDSLLNFGLRLPTNVQLNYPEQAVPIPGLYTFTPGFDHRDADTHMHIYILEYNMHIAYQESCNTVGVALKSTLNALRARFAQL